MHSNLIAKILFSHLYLDHAVPAPVLFQCV